VLLQAGVVVEPEFKSYQDLRVWQNAMTLAEHCYQVTSAFPKEEMYGLTAQMRRSAVSIAANIAEGHGRESTGAFVQFLRNAQGSLKELETHLLLATRVKLTSQIKTQPLLMQCDELGRMLRSLIRSLQRKNEEA
jgi:four helix bundle protein